MKEIIKKTYEAFDGKIFVNKKDCEKYEDRKRREADQAHEDYKRLFEMKVNEVIPLCEHTLNFESWYFNWFKVNNKEDLELINRHIKEEILEVHHFPSYVCIESSIDIWNHSNRKMNHIGEYGATFEKCIVDAKYFFNEFGYDIEIKKREN